MEVISHRGYWKDASEKNTRQAFERSFSLGFGTETDVRDLGGKLVISHDPPEGHEISLDDLLDLAKPFHVPLALNVKADGLASQIHETMRRHGYQNWFVFDMSIPDTRGQLSASNPVFIRMSEIEPVPPFMDVVAGVWLDAFEADSWRIQALHRLIAEKKSICLVSPELHKRDQYPFWQELKDAELHLNQSITLCTDFPEDAVAFFGDFA